MIQILVTAEIIIENRSNDIKSQLVEINNRSKEGDQIVMIVGHASERDIKYMKPFVDVFDKVVVSKLVQSSTLGELSEGGEQVFYGKMNKN